MRVSPVGWAFSDLEQTLAEAKKSAEVTHNHPEGIKGAQATAAAIFLARTGSSKEQIKEFVEKTEDHACRATNPDSVLQSSGLSGSNRNIFRHGWQ